MPSRCDWSEQLVEVSRDNEQCVIVAARIIDEEPIIAHARRNGKGESLVAEGQRKSGVRRLNGECMDLSALQFLGVRVDEVYRLSFPKFSKQTRTIVHDVFAKVAISERFWTGSGKRPHLCSTIAA
ncbi:MAG: hypothetical protein QGG71_26925 [Pirellulaceae bacterium]|nr:hypothetical protein [Pirellulaceae bacterium]